jgi:hypothetical protein
VSILGALFYLPARRSERERALETADAGTLTG